MTKCFKYAFNKSPQILVIPDVYCDIIGIITIDITLMIYQNHISWCRSIISPCNVTDYKDLLRFCFQKTIPRDTWCITTGTQSVSWEKQKQNARCPQITLKKLEHVFTKENACNLQLVIPYK